MRRRIAQYRKADATSLEDYSIGCILLAKPFFLSEPEWIPVPSNWSAAIQQGKRYDLEQEPGASLFQRVQHALSNEAASWDGSMQLGDANAELADRYGAPVLVAPRLGQGAFRVMVTDAYERRCAMTGEKVLPVLQAAHIRPFAREGPHRVQNGILLRSDLHTLFDRGYVTVASDLRLEVSRRLHEDFENGRDYNALHGNQLRVPASPELRPAGEFLSWHSENVYRG
jgi:putative restriction endonuclease